MTTNTSGIYQPADRISSDSKKRPFGQLETWGPNTSQPYPMTKLSNTFNPGNMFIPTFNRTPSFDPTSNSQYNPSSSVLRATQRPFVTIVKIETKFNSATLPNFPLTTKGHILFIQNDTKLTLTHINNILAEKAGPNMNFEWVFANVVCYGVLRNHEESALADSGPRFWDSNLPKKDWTADALEVEGYTTTKNIWPCDTKLIPGTILGFLLIKRRVSGETYKLHNSEKRTIQFSYDANTSYAWQFIPVAVHKITQKLIHDYVNKYYSHYEIDLEQNWCFHRVAMLKEQRLGGVSGADTNWDKLSQASNIPIHVMSLESYVRDYIPKD